MKQSKKTRQESALERRQKELKFWKAATTKIDPSYFGKAARHLTNFEQITEHLLKEDVEAMIKSKIQICEKDIKRLEAKK